MASNETIVANIVESRPTSTPGFKMNVVLDGVAMASKAELDSAIEELKNNPDVADVVASKTALDAYDTKKLTASAVVKVLKDETLGDVTSYYRWDGSKFTLVGKLDKYTVEHITSDKGTSRIENHEDGGVMTMVTQDNKWGGVCVNDGSDDLLVEAYAVNGDNTTGTRIIMNEEKAYYTKGQTNTTKTDADEIATVGEVEAKTTAQLTSEAGTSLIFNEQDGGGSKFEHQDKTHSFIGVNSGGKDGIAAQAYALTDADTEPVGTRLNIYTKGIYYQNKANSSDESRDKAEWELATKGDVSAATASATKALQSAQEELNAAIATAQSAATSAATTALQASEKKLNSAITALTTPKALTKDNIYNTPGTFLFTGNSDDEGSFPTTGCDWVGIQMAHGSDAFQIVGTNQLEGNWGLWFRACDGKKVDEGTTKNDWTKWDRMIVGTEFDKLKARVAALEAAKA